MKEIPGRAGIGAAIKEGIRDLYPGYFALVMATGIVSIATFLVPLTPIAWLLFGINLVAYALLWVFTVVRALWYSPFLIADLTSHARGPGFLTLVASTCVLGSQFVVIVQDPQAGLALWAVGALLWLLQIYAFLTAVVIREPKPSIEAGLNGGWLVTVVATQSVSLLGTLLADRFSSLGADLLFAMLTLFLLGCMLYLLIIGLIFYRLVFFTLTPGEFRPPYWINMGAIAVTTLAGSTLVLDAPMSSLVQVIRPFLLGFTLFFWSAATFWIPLLLILEIWRYFDHRLPVRYDPRDWDIVFPLGMYTVATHYLGVATGTPLLVAISSVFVYIALAGWLVVFLGMAWSMMNQIYMMRLG